MGMEFLLTVGVMALCLAGLGLGVIFSRPSVRGHCGGKGRDEDRCGSCTCERPGPHSTQD